MRVFFRLPFSLDLKTWQKIKDEKQSKGDEGWVGAMNKTLDGGVRSQQIWKW